MAQLDLYRCLAKAAKELLEEKDPAVHAARLAIDSLLSEIEKESGPKKDYCESINERIDKLEESISDHEDRIDEAANDANNCYSFTASEELEERIKALEEKFDDWTDCDEKFEAFQERLQAAENAIELHYKKRKKRGE